MRKVLVFLLIALSFSWNAAKAQELDDPGAQSREYWAAPSCNGATKAVTLTKYFEITADKTSFGIVPKTDKDSQMGKKSDYVSCPAMSRLLPQHMQRLARYLDRIKDKCIISVKNDCARVMFKFADENNDRQLYAPELKKAILSALVFAEVADKKKLEAAETKKIQIAARTEADKMTKELLARYDSDKSDSLDYNELTPEKFTPPSFVGMKETLRKIGNLIPAFGLASKAF